MAPIGRKIAALGPSSLVEGERANYRFVALISRWVYYMNNVCGDGCPRQAKMLRHGFGDDNFPADEIEVNVAVDRRLMMAVGAGERRVTVKTTPRKRSRSRRLGTNHFEVEISVVGWRSSKGHGAVVDGGLMFIRGEKLERGRHNKRSGVGSKGTRAG